MRRLLLVAGLIAAGLAVAGPAGALPAPPPTLTIQNTASQLFGAGQGAQYALLVGVSNQSAGPETQPVTVTDQLPAGVTLDGRPKGLGWNCAATTASTVSCTATPPRGGLVKGNTFQILIVQLLVDASAPLGSHIVDTASATSTDAVGPAHETSTARVVAAVGYLVAASQNIEQENGAVLPFGQVGQFGALRGNVHLVGPIVGITVRPDNLGDWLVASDGGVFSFGTNRFFGSLGNTALAAPIVGMAQMPDFSGYWLVGSDGGVFTFGSAKYLGGLGNVHLAAPVVGMAATPDGRGYWLVGADGGVFSFGTARYLGGLGGVHLNWQIVGIAGNRAGNGYWLVGADGGVFTFGAARFYGSLGGRGLSTFISGMAPVPCNLGYWLVGADGTVYNFGAAPYYGSATSGQLEGFAAVGIAP